MSRIRLPHSLPPLTRFEAEFWQLVQSRTKTAALLEVLRHVARAGRGETGQPFYSARAVCAAFGLPMSIVLRVFAALEQEGLLLRLRGSGTLLQPGKVQPSTPVRGVVGVPLWQYGYCNLTDWRLLAVSLEEALRRHGFVADLIFYQTDDPARLRERLVAHHLDYLVWFKPLAEHAMIMNTLADGGVHIAAVTHRGVPLSQPGYRLRIEVATRRAFVAWRRAGLRSVVVAMQPPPVPEYLARIHALTEAAQLDCHPEFLADAQSYPELLARLARRPACGVWWPDDLLLGVACQHHLDRVVRLVRRHRVLTGEHLEIPESYLTGCQFETTAFHWPTITARIADDIATGRLLQQKAPVTFDAKLHLRADATRFAQAF